MTSKKCSKCNKEFECKADSRGCWCEQYNLSSDTLQQLRTEFNDCLCPECLAIYQSADTTPVNRVQ